MHSRFIQCCTVIASLAIGGCVNGAPDPETERAAAAAAGLPVDASIRFMPESPDDSPHASSHLSVADVVRLSVTNSPDVQAALARVRIAQADALQARLLPNPILNVALRFPESGGEAIVDAGLSADLLAVLRRPGAVGAADRRLRAASAEAVVVVLDVAASAQEQFVVASSLEAALAVLAERRGLLDRLVELAESRLRLGEGTRLDVVTLQTQSAQLEVEIAEQELELRERRLALARAVGTPSSAAAWTLVRRNAPPDPVPDEGSCVAVALARRAEVEQARWELEALGFDRSNAGWVVLEGFEAGADAERDEDWSVGPAAAVPVPLFDLGGAGRARASAAVVEARHRLASARRRVIEEARRAHAALAATQRNLRRVQSELIPLEEDRLRQAEAQFRAGQADVTALLTAEQDLRAARARLIELERRAVVARVQLERAVGGAGALYEAATGAATQPIDARGP